jgi:cyclopropane fatty-acyl-phospholipid synthase-like methyltransferase
MNPLIVIAGIIFVCFGFVVLRGAPYLPSHRKQVRRAFTELYTLGKGDRVIDLGSGDGTVLEIANSLGAKAIGYEINPILVLLTKLRFMSNKNIMVELKDYLALEQVPADVTVVYAFTTSRSIESIGKKVEQWSKSQDIHVISYGFTLKNRKVDRNVGPMNLYIFKHQA